MYVVINIAGDPTSWWTESLTDANALVEELARGPAKVGVFFPVTGTLVISPAASVAVFDTLPTLSWIPSGVQAPVATLYVQSEPAGELAGYRLPAGTNLDDVASRIAGAMAGRGTVAVAVSADVGSGVAVLNGASLTFAVICPPPG
jgi:hypothetical protein